MKRILAYLLISLQLFSAPVWAVDRYVSKSAVNGIPAGNDTTGTGTIAAPWATIAKGLSTSTDGDQVIINCDTYAEAGLFPVKTLTLTPFSDYCVTIAPASGNTGLVFGTSSAGKTITVGKIILEGSSARPYGVDMQDSTGAAYTVALNGTRIQNFTTHGVTARGVLNKVVFSSKDVDITRDSAGTVTSGYFFGGLLTGSSVVIDGGVITLARQNVATHGLANVFAVNSGIPITIKNVKGTMTIETGLTGTSTHVGLRCINGNPCLVTGNDLTIDDNGTTRNIYSIAVTAGLGAGGLPAPIDTNDARIEGNKLRVIYLNGVGIICGQDGTTAADNFNDNCVITRNKVFGSPRSEGGSGHGMLAGYSPNMEVSYNWIGDDVGGFYLGVALKGSSAGSRVFGNLIRGAKGYCITTRGTTGAAVTNNSCVQPTSTYTVGYCLYNWADSPTFATSSVYSNNLCAYYAPAANGIVYSETGSDATFSNNDYFAPGTLPNGAFQYGGVSYATLPLWLAAGRETTAFNFDPMLLKAANEEYFRLRPTSPIRQAGAAGLGVTVDYTGRSFPTPPPIGAMRALRVRSDGTVGP